MLGRFDRLERREGAPEGVHARELPRVEELLLFARARRVDVDRREDAALGDAPVEHELHVARPLELLKDDLVHLTPRPDDRGGEDREAAAVLDVARRAEELSRKLERPAVDPARHRLAAPRLPAVRRAAETRER